MSRKINFYAGPSVLPVEVLEQLRDEIVDYHGLGLSLIETSHRSREYDDVHNQAADLVRELFQVPDNFRILFLGGGATLQFSMVPLNFLSGGRSCDFTLTGSWAKKAFDDAKKVGGVKVIFDGSESSYSSLPDPGTVPVNPDAAYLHITSNETIGGIQWQSWPNTGSVPMIADMSSDIMSRSVPVENFGMIYAGAQKNLGPAGATLVIIRDDLVDRCPDTLTAYLNYKTHVEKNSLYNTPPVFSIYAMKLVLEGMKASGGVVGAQKRNEEKAGILYSAIDESGGFYHSPVKPEHRSRMNIVFRLGSEELESKFIAESAVEGMVGLKGHRSVGGCRASVYNSMPLEGVKTLGEFMKDFAKRNG